MESHRMWHFETVVFFSFSAMFLGFIHIIAYASTWLYFLLLSNIAMATHSCTLAWRIPWTEKPGRLQSMGSHRVGHDWSDWAAAAAILHGMEKPRSVYSLVSRWAFELFTYWLLWIMLMWTFTYMFLHRCIFDFSIYLEWNFWIMVTLCLTFWDTARLFSKATVPFYISTISVWGFLFPHNLANSC